MDVLLISEFVLVYKIVYNRYMIKEKEAPNFFAIIPAGVRYNKKLNSTEKLFFGEITALANKEGYCWASNGYFAELYGLSIKQVSNIINNLKELNFLKVFIDVKAGNVRKIYPIITFGEEKTEAKGLRELFDEMIGKIEDEALEEREAFIDYWTAKNPNSKKEHWQKQKTFSIKQRWGTWMKNKKEWSKPKYEKVPSDDEIRKDKKKEVRMNNTERMLKNTGKPRTKEEQASINKSIANVRASFNNKFSM